MSAAAGWAVSSRALAQGEVAAPAQTKMLADDRPRGPMKPIAVPITWDLKPAQVPSVRLGQVDTPGLLREDAAAAAGGDKRLRYGVGRDIAVGMSSGSWNDIPAGRGGGRVWVADIIASGAIGVRVHLTGLDLPVGAAVTVYSPDDLSLLAGPYEGKGPIEDGQVWTPTRAGERVRVECRVPGLAHGATPAHDLFRIDRIQHIYRDPTGGAPDLPCHNDVTCYAAWAVTARACAGVGFIWQNSVFCSGQLLNTLAADQTPYFLTANQCVNTWAQAQTCEFFFNYRTAVCDGPGPALANVPRAAVASVLSTQQASDFSLLMIEGTLPMGVAWAGWTSERASDGTAAACLHFPLGSHERISFGTKASDTTCGGQSHVRMNWTSGPTEPGSAGGGVFRDDVNQQLFGQLSCGTSACGNVTNDDFGSFNSTYPFIAGLLGAGSDDALEPNNGCSAAAPVAGAFSNLIVKSTAEDWYAITIPARGTASCQLSFTHANGDIDVQMFTACGGQVVASSTGQTGGESIVWSNPSPSPQPVLFRVYLASDTRNAYTMTLGVQPPASGACCLPGGVCSVLTSATCAASGGVYAGLGAPCPSSCSLHSYAGPPVPIADGTGSSGCGPLALASIAVLESFTISNVSVGVYIPHAYQGDLKFSLRHVETGRTVQLVDRPGVPQSTFGFPNDNYGAGPGTLFRNVDAALQVYDLPAAGVNNVSGAWKSESPLSAFAGEDASGTWQLQVQDCAAGETGSVAAFQLTMTRTAPAMCYPNCDGSTAQPLLSANDFVCFVTRYATGESYANCDGSTLSPVLSANDFVCFITQYAVGCS